jgi:hypothetical protein
MKQSLCTIGIAAIALGALAALPTYKTQSAVGNAAAPSIVYFNYDPNSQIRVIYANYNTDTNNSVLSFATGGTTFYIQATNQATSSTTNQISGTNGLSGSAVLLLHHAGTIYSATASSWTSSTNAGIYGLTNVVLSSGGWGVATSVGDEVEVMSTATTIPAPAAASGSTTTAAFSGDALYVGNYGRDVSVAITPAFITNKLNSVSAHYDSASQ